MDLRLGVVTRGHAPGSEHLLVGDVADHRDWRRLAVERVAEPVLREEQQSCQRQDAENR